MAHDIKTRFFVLSKYFNQWQYSTEGATGVTAVVPAFLDALTLFQPGGQVLPNITEVAQKFLHGYISTEVDNVDWVPCCIGFSWKVKTSMI